MLYAILGLIIGILTGLIAPLTIPISLSRYTAVAIVAILDSILGALAADLKGKYLSTIFLSGLMANIVLGAGITYLGDRIGLDLYLAVLIALMIRILSNLGIIRQEALKKYLEKRGEK